MEEHLDRQLLGANMLQMIATRGLDAAVRGLNTRNRGVDVAGIDDPDKEETVNSEEQAKKLEKRIDRAIAGLGGQRWTVARVMLTTIQNRTCVSFKFTDPSQKPTCRPALLRQLGGVSGRCKDTALLRMPAASPVLSVIRREDTGLVA